MGPQQAAAVVRAAAAALTTVLASPNPDIAAASCIMGVVQEMLLAHKQPVSEVEFGVSASAYQQRFAEQLVAPGLAKLLTTRPRSAADKVVTLAKLLRGRLAKAPAHKQPLHTQFLPSALRDTGKRQLDCVGIGTAVLAMCHAVAAAAPQQHGELSAAMLVVSDDHCWIGLPVNLSQHSNSTVAQAAATVAPLCKQQQQQQEHHQQQQQQQRVLVHVEVTEPRVLAANDMRGWLYAGGEGEPLTPAQVVVVLVGALMPEESKDRTAALALRTAQQDLLLALLIAGAAAQLDQAAGSSSNSKSSSSTELTGGSTAHCSELVLQWVCALSQQQQQQYPCAQQQQQVPPMLQTPLVPRKPPTPPYSALFRWGMLAEEAELSQLAAAAQHGCTAEYARLVRLGAQELASQRLYAAASAASGGRMWHPASCAAFGFFNRLQVALCGETDDLLALQQQTRERQPPAADADADADATAAHGGGSVSNKGCCSSCRCCDGPPCQDSPPAAAEWRDAAETLLRSALAVLPGCTAVLRRYAGAAGQPDKSADSQLVEALTDLMHNLSDACQALAILRGVCAAPGAAGGSRNGAGAGVDHSSSSSSSSRVGLCPPDAQEAAVNGTLGDGELLHTPLQLLDALCCYYGDDGELPGMLVEHFVDAARTFTPAARAAAAAAMCCAAAAGAGAAALGEGVLVSARLRGLAVSGCPVGDAWHDLGAELQQALQLPSSRKRQRRG
jgi:hypothetical protein